MDTELVHTYGHTLNVFLGLSFIYGIARWVENTIWAITRKRKDAEAAAKYADACRISQEKEAQMEAKYALITALDKQLQYIMDSAYNRLSCIAGEKELRRKATLFLLGLSYDFNSLEYKYKMYMLEKHYNAVKLQEHIDTYYKRSITAYYCDNIKTNPYVWEEDPIRILVFMKEYYEVVDTHIDNTGQ